MLESTERRYTDGGVRGEPVAHDVYIAAQQGFSKSRDGPPSIWLVARATSDVLAALRHQREATFALLRPVSADVGVSEVPVTDGLNMLDIDELAELL